MSTLGKVVAGLVLAPIAILVVGIGGCEARKAYYDWQVREMCEKDGGAIVYERMAISPELFKKMQGDLGGGLAVPHESKPDTGFPIFWRSEEKRIRDGHLSITRSEILIIRRSDEKILGKDVQYGRSGGDFPYTASHTSSFACPILKTPFTRQILFDEGATK